MDNLTLLKDIATVVGPFATAAAVVYAGFQYSTNNKLERSKWQAQLDEKFYERNDLKPIRQLMDSDDEISLEITNLIRQEPAEFTDYLNFFEFVAFLKKSKQLKIDEIDDLFGYYLDCLNRREDVREYVKKRGYELLDELLSECSANKK